jgi:hypothetical protein
MRSYEIIVGVLVIVAIVAAMRWQYGRVMGEVTDPDQDNYQVIPVTTPVVKPLCGPAYSGNDCLPLP